MGNNQGKEEEIIVKCEIPHMVKQFFRDSIAVWHDPNIDAPENKPSIAQLENFCQVKIFTQQEEALTFLKGTKATCHVITTSEKHLGEFIGQACENQNVYGVYVLSKIQESWVSTNPKVECVETNIHNILFKIERNLVQSYEEKVSSGFSFAPLFNEIDQCKRTLRHTSLKTILNFKDRLQAKNDFLTLCKVLYSDERNFDFIINLTQNYNEQNALNWYTQQSLFPKVINRCLAISSTDSLQYCRLPLHDIQKAIHDQYLRKCKELNVFSGLLYKAAYLHPGVWTHLKGNLQKDIETIDFFSAYKNPRTALNTMQTDPKQKVIITIRVPKGSNGEEHGFAEMEQDPNHVLFNLTSRFTILEANEKYSEDLPHRHLVLVYGAHGFRRYLAEQNPSQIMRMMSVNKQEVLCDFCKSHVLQKSPKFFFRSTTDQSHYCQECLPPNHTTPFYCVPVSDTNNNESTKQIKISQLASPPNLKILFYDYKCCSCQQANLANFCLKCADCHQKWCKKCIDNAENCIKEGHIVLAKNAPSSPWHQEMSETEVKTEESLKSQNHSQLSMFARTGEYQKQIDYLLRQEKSLHVNDDPKSFIVIYEKIGLAYASKEDYQKALEYFMKALKICKPLNLDKDLYLRDLYAYLGTTYHCLGDFGKAEECYVKSLEICKTTQGKKELKVANMYNKIGALYTEQAKFKDSLQISEKALELAKKNFGEKSSSLSMYYSNLGRAYYNLGEYQKALELYSKVVEIAKLFPGDPDQLEGYYYGHLGRIAELKGEYQKALNFEFKALEISQLFSGETPLKNASHYRTIGLMYKKLEKAEKALEYFLKAEEILKKNSSGNPAKAAGLYRNIGSAYNMLGDYEKALEYESKALEITEKALGENRNHSNLADCYSGLGQVYCSKKDYKAAMGYHVKSLEIRKEVYGEDHPDVAACYVDMGDVLRGEEEHEKASEYYVRALEMRKLVFAEDHPEIVSIQKKIEGLKEEAEI